MSDNVCSDCGKRSEIVHTFDKCLSCLRKEASK